MKEYQPTFSQSWLEPNSTYFEMPMHFSISMSNFVITCFCRIYHCHKKFCERVTSDKSIVKLKKSLETIHKIVLNGNVTDIGFQILGPLGNHSSLSTTVPPDRGELSFLWSHKNWINAQSLSSFFHSLKFSISSSFIIIYQLKEIYAIFPIVENKLKVGKTTHW